MSLPNITTSQRLYKRLYDIEQRINTLDQQFTSEIILLVMNQLEKNSLIEIPVSDQNEEQLNKPQVWNTFEIDNTLLKDTKDAVKSFLSNSDVSVNLTIITVLD